MTGNMMGNIKLSNYLVLGPELFLCGCALLLLVYGVYRVKQANNFLILTSIFVLLVTAWLDAGLPNGKAIVMNGMFITDQFAVMVKILLLGSGALTLLMASGWLREQLGKPFEFVILLLLATLGMMLMVSANDLLAMYMALEMSSLSLYVMASFERDHAKSSEAGLKYFVLGALASGMMLFGMSLVYGFAGTTSFASLAQLFAHNGDVVSKGVIVGLILIVVGLCFKISAVPFHMWTPDVYEGAPTPVAAFFATAPKIAALALFTRVMMQPFGHLVVQWQQVIIFASVASMVVGALAAIMQTNIKRLLAYSSIGNAGFMLLGLAAASIVGVQAILIYLALYIFMSAGAFGCVLLMRRDGHYVEDIKDLAGASQTHPVLALVISVFMFSMAGIPPLAGFFGKFYVVLAAVNAGLAWVAVIGVISSVVSGYYYVRVVKVMYFDEPVKALDHSASVILFRPVIAAIALCAAVTLLFFLVPTPLVAQAQLAAEALVK